MMNVTHASTRFYRVEECEFNALNQALCSLNLLKTLATTSDAQQMDCIELGNLLGLIVGCFEKGFFPVADRGATDKDNLIASKLLDDYLDNLRQVKDYIQANELKVNVCTRIGQAYDFGLLTFEQAEKWRFQALRALNEWGCEARKTSNKTKGGQA